MWSGLLPPGLNESDVDLSSDDGDESRSSISKEAGKEDAEGVQLSEWQENGPASSAISEAPVIAGGENESQTCPSGIPLNMWNVGILTGLSTICAGHKCNILTVTWLMFEVK